MLKDVVISKAHIPLPLEFYERKTDEVAVELLGKLLVRETHDAVMIGRIVETEAYFGEGDPASHACRGVTPRSAIMFGPAGRAYVYLNYGVHHLLNVVTEREGSAGAVLIRALEPVADIDKMLKNRPVKNEVDLTNGPGKLTKALSVDLSDNGVNMTAQGSQLFIADDGNREFSVKASSRIGISAGTDLLLRFTIDGNLYVSR